jgi:hypothetical protein
MDKIKLNSWDELQTLEAVIVGSVYDSSFFDGVKNTRIADVLKKIVDETNEDIDYLKTQLKSHNIQVLQATPKELGYKDSILDYVDVNGKMGFASDRPDLIKKNMIPTSPLQVRDDSIVMGNKLLITDKTFEVEGYVKKFIEWFGEDQIDLSIYNGTLEFKRSELNLIAAAKDPKVSLAPAVRGNLLDSQSYMKAASKVVRVKTTAKLPKNLERPSKVKDSQSLQELTEAWGIERQIKRFLKTLNIDWVA